MYKLVAKSCHLDRLRGSEATEVEWRDREDARTTERFPYNRISRPHFQQGPIEDSFPLSKQSSSHGASV